MPPVKIRLAAACALLVLAATGCGSSGDPSSAKIVLAQRLAAAPRATASGPLAKQMQTLQDRAQQDSQFSEVTRKPTGEEISSIRGRYSLDDEQVAATFRVPDTSSGKEATARLAIVGKDAFLQVDQWKQPSRGCWLKTTLAGALAALRPRRRRLRRGAAAGRAARRLRARVLAGQGPDPGSPRHRRGAAPAQRLAQEPADPGAAVGHGRRLPHLRRHARADHGARLRAEHGAEQCRSRSTSRSSRASPPPATRPA